MPFGHTTDEERYEADIERALSDEEIKYESIDQAGDDAYKIKLVKAGEVTISTTKDVKGQISSLQYILFRLTMEGKQFDQLDLRFDKPVVVLSK